MVNKENIYIMSIYINIKLRQELIPFHVSHGNTNYIE